MGEATIEIIDAGRHVAVIEFHHGSYNFFNRAMIDAIADAMAQARAEGARALVLASVGKHFCAGMDFGGGPSEDLAGTPARHLYDAALRLFQEPLPIVAAVQGGAIGGGLGLAMACDFRIASEDVRLAAPFARLGLHHGFGLSATLPLVVGHQHALNLLYTARRVKAEEARAMQLVDEVVPLERLRERAIAFAAECAATAPIALQSIKQTLRGHLPDAIRAATAHEKAEQAIHQATEDFREGVSADLERRAPVFQGR